MLSLLLLIGCQTYVQQAKADALAAELPMVTHQLGVALAGEHGLDAPWLACAPGACVPPASIEGEQSERLNERFVWRINPAERGGDVCVREIETARCMCSASGDVPTETPCDDVLSLPHIL